MNGKITSLTTQSENLLVVKGVFMFILILVAVTVVIAANGGRLGEVFKAVTSFIGTVG